MPEEKPGSIGQADAGSAGTGKKPAVDAATLNRENVQKLYKIKCEAASIELPRRLPAVWEYCKKHIAAGRLWPLFDGGPPLYPIKLLELWQILQTEKPSKVLELGTGCTTAVFAEYGCEFTTIDENAEFQKAVLNDIKRNVKAAIAAKISIADIECSYGMGLPEFNCAKALDLLYVDGPSGEVPSTDAISIDPPSMILFDIRRSTVEKTRRHFGDLYHWDLSCWYDNASWYLSALRHHTIARRIN